MNTMEPNNHGFSLIQVIVAIALMSIIGLILASMISNSYQHEARLSMLLESREFSGEFLELARSTNCGIKQLKNPMNIEDPDWKKTTIYELEQGVSGRFMNLKAGDNYGSIKVEKISISPYLNKKSNTLAYVAMDGSNDTDFANAKKIRVSLKMEISSPKGVKAPLEVPIYLYVDPSKGKITGCDNAEENANMAAMCKGMSGQWNEDNEVCSLPCPGGMDKVNDKCVMIDSGDSSYCNANEQCSVDKKYIL